jgi:hypothetical protein
LPPTVLYSATRDKNSAKYITFKELFARHLHGNATAQATAIITTDDPFAPSGATCQSSRCNVSDLLHSGMRFVYHSMDSDGPQLLHCTKDNFCDTPCAHFLSFDSYTVKSTPYD